MKSIVLLIRDNNNFQKLGTRAKLQYFMKLKYFELFNEEKFKKLVKELVEIEVK